MFRYDGTGTTTSEDPTFTNASLYRNCLHLTRRSNNLGDQSRPSWLAEIHGLPQPDLKLDEEIILSGALTPSTEALFSHHIVGGTILLPGVGYIEMAFAASSYHALTAVAFLRPCVLSGPGLGEKCVLRCTRQGSGTL